MGTLGTIHLRQWKKTKRSTINELTITLRNKCLTDCVNLKRDIITTAAAGPSLNYLIGISACQNVLTLRQLFEQSQFQNPDFPFVFGKITNELAIFISNYYFGINPEPITKFRA